MSWSGQRGWAGAYWTELNKIAEHFYLQKNIEIAS